MNGNVNELLNTMAQGLQMMAEGVSGLQSALAQEPGEIAKVEDVDPDPSRQQTEEEIQKQKDEDEEKEKVEKQESPSVAAKPDEGATASDPAGTRIEDTLPDETVEALASVKKSIGALNNSFDSKNQKTKNNNSAILNQLKSMTDATKTTFEKVAKSLGSINTRLDEQDTAFGHLSGAIGLTEETIKKSLGTEVITDNINDYNDTLETITKIKKDASDLAGNEIEDKPGKPVSTRDLSTKAVQALWKNSKQAVT